MAYMYLAKANSFQLNIKNYLNLLETETSVCVCITYKHNHLDINDVIYLHH